MVDGAFFIVVPKVALSLLSSIAIAIPSVLSLVYIALFFETEQGEGPFGSRLVYQPRGW